MGRIRLTQTVVQKSEPRSSRYTLYDETPGLMLRVEPSGNKIYYADYSKDGKRSSYKLGSAAILTVAQAREASREFLAKIALGEEVPGKRTDFSSVTVGEYLEESYFPWVVVNRKSGKSTVKMLQAAFAFLWDIKIHDLNIMQIERWRLDRIKDVKAASINRILTALKSALNWGVKRNLIQSNPLARMERLQERDSQAKVRYLSEDERTRLMKALDDREEALRKGRDQHNKWLRERKQDEYPDLRRVIYADYIKPMVLISLNTGIRRGVLLGLLWGDVDFKARILTLRSEEEKTGKLNHVPLNDVAISTFMNWRKQTKDKGDEALVFPSPKTGNRIGHCCSAWKTLMKMANIQNFRWHDMRHDFPSQLVMRGVDLNTVRELMGHADLKMTLRYAHLAPSAKVRAVQTLEVMHSQ